MKIAICISGQPRFTGLGLYSLNEVFLKKYNCDIFVQTYNTEDGLQFIRTVQPKRYRLDHPNDTDIQISKYASINKAAETNVLTMYLMYRNIKNCMDLIDAEYNLVIRTRSDLLYGSPLDLSKVNPDSIYIPQGGDWRGGVFDMFAISGIHGMSYYSSIFSKLNEYVERGVHAHPEILMRYHLMFNQHNFSLVRFPWDIKVIRAIKDSNIHYDNALPLDVF